ncbi:MAG: hypothetical protein AB1578_19010 [Thermodesulfobacteriota bacterium]
MEGLGFPAVADIAKNVGPIGFLVLLGWLNMRWVDRQRSEERDRVDAVLLQYKRDVDQVASMYRDNVTLVKETQHLAQRVAQLAEELSSIVHLSTQVQTRLVEKIDNNMFCPLVRAKGPQG